MKNVIRYATLLAKGRFITCAELPDEPREPPQVKTSVSQLRDGNHEIDLTRTAL